MIRQATLDRSLLLGDDPSDTEDEEILDLETARAASKALEELMDEPKHAKPKMLTKAERVHRVITNPKARVENMADRGQHDREGRPLPTHIEGFPQLSIAKSHLLQGW